MANQGQGFREAGATGLEPATSGVTEARRKMRQMCDFTPQIGDFQ
jgi:hypothetical protein